MSEKLIKLPTGPLLESPQIILMHAQVQLMLMFQTTG